MKRILVYSSLSVLTAIGTVFAAANAEFFEGEETTPITASQASQDSINPAAEPITLGSISSGDNPLANGSSESLLMNPASADALSADIQPITLSANGPASVSSKAGSTFGTTRINAAEPTASEAFSARFTSDNSFGSFGGEAQPNPVVSQVPGTVTPDTTAPGVVPTAKPSVADPSAPESDEDTSVTDTDETGIDETGADGMETLSPVPGAVPLSPATPSAPTGADGVVPATPTEAPLGSPAIPSPPGTAPLEADPTDDELAPEAIEDEPIESDSFDASPAEAPLTDEPLIEEDAEMDSDMPLPAPPGSSVTPSTPGGVSPVTPVTPSAPDSNFTPAPDEGVAPSEPDSDFTPASPEGITPSSPDGDFTPAPDEDITPDAPDSNFTPASPDGITPGVPSDGFTPTEPDGASPLTPAAPPVESEPPAAPPTPLPPSPEAPTEALPPVNDDFDESEPLGSTSDRLVGEGFTPFQLSYLAIGGGLKDAGIPGGNQLLSAYEAGELSAQDIVEAGAVTKRLGTAASDEANYAKGVDKFLKLLSRDALNS